METINDVIKKLKYYSLKSVIEYCFIESKRLLSEKSPFEISKKVLPWELEVLLMLAIESTPKLKNESIIGKRDLYEIIRIIRNTRNKELDIRDEVGASLFFSATKLQQTEFQNNFFVYLYRYNFIFNYSDGSVNMTREFETKFCSSYKRYIELALLLYYPLAILDKEYLSEIQIIFKYVTINYKEEIEKLSFSEIDYKEEMDSMYIDPLHYIYGICPSYTKPFLWCDRNLSIPLPHLLMRAVTTSMLYELTKENEELRMKTGHILEEYMFGIIKNSLIYEEVQRDIKLKHKKKEFKTRDVNAYVNDEYLLIECKSYVPRIGIRKLDYQTYNYEIDRISTYICKIYKDINITRMKSKEYNCFEKRDICKADRNQIYSVLVLLDDPIINRQHLYKDASMKLGIKECSDDYDWMINHIKIMDYYTVEDLSIIGISIIDVIKDMEPYDYVPSRMYKNEVKNRDYQAFYTKCNNSFDSTIKRIFADRTAN